jgi:hypothetical protein
MPVPSSRRLLGDLAYYTVVLADERVVCVTSSVRGFYANRRSFICTNKNPCYLCVLAYC